MTPPARPTSAFMWEIIPCCTAATPFSTRHYLILLAAAFLSIWPLAITIRRNYEPKISKHKAERAKNDGKIAMLQSRNREIDEDIIKLENEDIVGLARATGMTMEELAQYLMHIKKGGSPFCSTQKEDMENAPEEN